MHCRLVLLSCGVESFAECRQADNARHVAGIVNDRRTFTDELNISNGGDDALQQLQLKPVSADRRQTANSCGRRH